MKPVFKIRYRVIAQSWRNFVSAWREMVSTADSQVIVGVESHEEHVHDSKTLKLALSTANRMRKTQIDLAVVDRGYRRAKKQMTTPVLLPGPPIKRDTNYQRQKKRRLCRKRAVIEPVIGHLKHDYRLTRNWLKGSDQIADLFYRENESMDIWVGII